MFIKWTASSETFPRFLGKYIRCVTVTWISLKRLQKWRTEYQ